MSPQTNSTGIQDEIVAYLGQPAGPVPTSEAARELTATQTGIAAMFGYGAADDDEAEQEDVDGQGPNGSSS